MREKIESFTFCECYDRLSTTKPWINTRTFRRGSIAAERRLLTTRNSMAAEQNCTANSYKALWKKLKLEKEIQLYIYTAKLWFRIINPMRNIVLGCCIPIHDRFYQKLLIWRILSNPLPGSIELFSSLFLHFFYCRVYNVDSIPLSLLFQSYWSYWIRTTRNGDRLTVIWNRII